VQDYVEHYNNARPNSATGYITPKDMLAGRQQGIHAARNRKLWEKYGEDSAPAKRLLCGTMPATGTLSPALAISRSPAPVSVVATKGGHRS
jgi:hypothetical protein